MTWRNTALLLLLAGLVWPASPLDRSVRSVALAQVDIAPCGYVDGFDFPVPDVDIKHTDFAIYRARFGGLHTGIDLAFEQLGEPVRAAARGQVTFSDPEGWDTEKGVVVVQHTLPDGTLVNTLYGHMEELNGHVFPPMGQCVERGDIVGAVGFPSRGRPHLHYEVRTRYRHEGGPGYTVQNPLELGWLHPVDFTFLANLWVHPAYRWHFTLSDRMTLPPLPLNDGTYVVADGGHVQAVAANGAAIWQFDTLGSVTGLLALPDGRVLSTGGNANRATHVGSGLRVDVLGDPETFFRFPTFRNAQGEEEAFDLDTYYQDPEHYFADGNSEPFVPAEIWRSEVFSPPYLPANNDRPRILSAPAGIAYGKDFSVRVGPSQAGGAVTKAVLLKTSGLFKFF